MRNMMFASALALAVSVCVPSELHAADGRPVRCVLAAARDRIRETLSTACCILVNVASRIQPTATLHLDGKHGPRIEFSYRITESKGTLRNP